MANPDRLMDKTHLSIDQAEHRGFIHRDYIAHCHRWSHVVKHLMRQHRYQDAHIIDVGCGKDQPLPRLLYSNKMTGFDYSGIDINRLDVDETLFKAHNNGKIRAAIHEQCDASELEPDKLKWGLGDYLVCFEVLEHIQPFIAARMLRNWKRLLNEDAILFVSTPVFNGKAAGNHINEMARETLGCAFEHHGYTILGNYGTFASQSDIKPMLHPSEAIVWDGLAEYYDTNVLSTIFAPLHPEASRNNFWILQNKKPVLEETKFLHWAMETFGTFHNQNADISQLFEG